MITRLVIELTTAQILYRNLLQLHKHQVLYQQVLRPNCQTLSFSFINEQFQPADNFCVSKNSVMETTEVMSDKMV